MIFAYLQKINLEIISIEVIQLKLENPKVYFFNKINFIFILELYLAESLADKTRIYWPYMALFIIGACLASFVLICCSYHKIRKSMYNKRKTNNFESKFIKKINFQIKIISLDLTYKNPNSHHSHINSNGKTSLGKSTCEIYKGKSTKSWNPTESNGIQ
jgi:hypothetical protein